MFKKLGVYFTRVLFLALILVFMSVNSVFAQETQPGDACAAGEDGHYRRSSMVTATDGGSMMFCNGVNWIGFLTYNSNGNVGVGTTTPSDLLTISGANKDIAMYSYDSSGDLSKADITLFRTRGTEGTPTSVLNGDGLGALRFEGHNGSSFKRAVQISARVDGVPGSGEDMPGRIEFHVAPDGGIVKENIDTPDMVLKSNGRLGIGTATPGVELDVIGSIQYTGTIQDVSDRRLKTDIVNLPSSQLDKLLLLQGVSFKMKSNPMAGTEIGLIAQDVENIFPDLVKTDINDMKSLNYVGLIAPLIESIKEQQAQIEALQARIDALEQKK